MDVEKVNIELQETYNRRLKSVEKRVSTSVEHLIEAKLLNLSDIELVQMKSLVSTILTFETKSLQEDVETLLAQKELVERSLEKNTQNFKSPSTRCLTLWKSNLKPNQPRFQNYIK